jgi:hypothetical protein
MCLRIGAGATPGAPACVDDIVNAFVAHPDKRELNDFLDGLNVLGGDSQLCLCASAGKLRAEPEGLAGEFEDLQRMLETSSVVLAAQKRAPRPAMAPFASLQSTQFVLSAHRMSHARKPPADAVAP